MELELGWELHKRNEKLREVEKFPSEKTHQLEFQNHSLALKIREVPIDLPKYRLTNGRTYAQQRKYQLKHPQLETKFFTQDFENAEVQQVQHGLLKELIEEKNLFYLLKKERQTEPLILTYDGFVLNGNRRLCAMRELLDEDKAKYSYFRNISIVILPPAEEKDLDELEAKLQVIQDVKAEYHWTSLSLKIKSLKEEHNYSDDELKVLYDMKKNDIDRLIIMIRDAENYLADRSDKDFEDLRKKEEGFKQLANHRKDLKSEIQRSLYERLAYCFIDVAEGGRVYDKIRKIPKYFNAITKELFNSYKIEPDSILNVDHDELLMQLIKITEDKENNNDLREVVNYVIEEEEDKEKSKNKHKFVANQILNAKKSLKNAVDSIERNKKSKKEEGIGVNLKEIKELILKLEEWINE